jgi:hypothetical protein
MGTKLDSYVSKLELYISKEKEKWGRTDKTDKENKDNKDKGKNGRG